MLSEAVWAGQVTGGSEHAQLGRLLRSGSEKWYPKGTPFRTGYIPNLCQFLMQRICSKKGNSQFYNMNTFFHQTSHGNCIFEPF